MNILVTSAGRRVKVIQYFKNAIKNSGRVIAADCDKNAPALYFADEFELIPRIDNKNYISSVLEVCKKQEINAIVSLIDPELEILAKNKMVFDQQNIKLILSPLEMVLNSFDKQKTYDYLTKIGIPSVPTYSDVKEVKKLLKEKQLFFPLVVKPGKGSASIGIHVVNEYQELEHVFSKSEGLIIQPFYKDREFGIDVYIDMKKGYLVDLFIKEKISMRSGETDKSISIHNDKVEELVKNFIDKTNFLGPIDIDCFEYKGEYFISEINPRFGGGYPHAYEMGCNFMEYIVNNLKGKVNRAYDRYKYDAGYIMMKYDDVIIEKHSY